MTWIKRDSREFWIGRHHKIGLVVLAEHQSAPKDSEFVSLFLVAEGRTASFKRSILRETISPAVGADDSRAAIHAFVGHLHRNFLKEEGFGFAGVRVWLVSLLSLHRNFLVSSQLRGRSELCAVALARGESMGSHPRQEERRTKLQYSGCS